MDNLKCCIAKDLMPLYIDDVLSEESAQALREHLEKCESCQREYLLLTKDLVLPSGECVQEENSRMLKKFKQQWTLKKILISVVSSVLAVFLFFPVRNAVMESELFDPVTKACAGTVGQLYLGELSDGEEWTRLYFIKEWLFSNSISWWEPYLIFDNIFYEKEAINSANSATAVEMRILDTEGNIVVEPFTIEPGRAVSLEQLENNIPYIVEYRADGDYYVFSFS